MLPILPTLAYYLGSTAPPIISRVPQGVKKLLDLFIGLAFVLMVIAPAILATVQKSSSHDADDDGRDVKKFAHKQKRPV
jgi:hypothetical protein